MQVSPRSEGPDKKHEALVAALTERDAARQMCQGVRAMLAQSEALRKADPDTKVLLDAGQDGASYQLTCCIEDRLALGLVTRRMPDVCSVLRRGSPLQVQLLNRETIQLRTALTRVCKEAAAYKQDIKAAQVRPMACALCPHALHFKACPYRGILRQVMGLLWRLLKSGSLGSESAVTRFAWLRADGPESGAAHAAGGEAGGGR